MINQDISENRAKIAYLAIGSNLGNKRLNIETAKSKLESYQIKVIKCSSCYETLSWPNPKKSTYINLVLKIQTNLSPQKLLKTCLIIENELGRIRNKKNDPRTCDIDIIDYEQIVTIKNGYQKLTLPHPELHKRNFVLLPLFEIAKSWTHPVKKIAINKLINSLDINDLRTIKLV